MKKWFITALVTSVVIQGVTASPAAAQVQGHVGGLLGLSKLDADFVEGTEAAPGIVGAVGVLKWLDIEGEFIVPSGKIVRQYAGTSVSFAPPGSTREAIDRLAVVTRFTNTRQTQSIASIGVAIHPRNVSGRVTPRFFVGMVSHYIRDHRTLEHLTMPPGVTVDDVNRIIRPEESNKRQIGGVSLGGGLIIRIADHFAVAPDVRYDYMSIGDEINNALRSSIRGLWRF